jgi:peptidoglycan/xylan/chitin deacetylase (PgdA/CDA1 family)
VSSIALTFDDGPSQWTPPILDLLAAHDAHATFFLIGCVVEERSEIVSRIVDEGHEVGNHTWSHPRLAAECDDERVLDEFRRANEAIAAIAQSAPRRFRAPFYDVDDRVECLAATLGLAHTPRDVVPPDWHAGARSAVVATLVLQQVKPGSIVGLHDGVPPREGRDGAVTRELTVDAVATFLPRLAEKGYECVTASSLLDRRS